MPRASVPFWVALIPENCFLVRLRTTLSHDPKFIERNPGARAASAWHAHLYLIRTVDNQAAGLRGGPCSCPEGAALLVRDRQRGLFRPRLRGGSQCLPDGRHHA